MKTSVIRQKFLDFFASKGHQIVSSSPVIAPGNDPSLLFANAGMNQFKDVFLGVDKRSYNRAASAQKCIRAGGKHNDLEHVGYTARHHTFFEMLGNFSFGDYFKREAIHFAWEFLTDQQWLGLPKEKLLITVYATDDITYDIWVKEIGVSEQKVIFIGDKKGAPYISDNFWSMGDTGPCGPCSEIFYDHGEHIWGGPPGSVDEDGDRFVEIWNCVFMQFNRAEDGSLHPLPKPSVDTGMGLERISAVMQHTPTNYEIDLFQALIQAAARETGVPFSLEIASLKVIADHIRACAFIIADGVSPSNEGRGYVLRRITRRAIRHGYQLGQKELFFHRLVTDLVDQMGSTYPELLTNQATIEATLKQEELRFAQTLENGMTLLESALKHDSASLNGNTIFKLYDTFGFPVDLTLDICRERHITADIEGFEREMDAQRQRARMASSFKSTNTIDYEGANTLFQGYEKNQVHARVLALYKHTERVDILFEGDEGTVVLDNTAFYAEGGGQIGDKGTLSAVSDTSTVFNVTNTQKITPSVIGHQGYVSAGQLRLGDIVVAAIDQHKRRATSRTHSATHLLHCALRQVLGTHVTQKGSLVETERTRFDFAHHEPLTPGQLAEVESIVNEAIAANYPINATLMPFDKAVDSGAIALFGERYGDEVRVLKMGDFSAELCGGTHVSRTGDIGYFKIVSEGSIAAGTRRIEAVTGDGASAVIQQQDTLIKEIANLLQTQNINDIPLRISALQDNLASLEKELGRLKAKLVADASDTLATNAVSIAGVKVLAAVLKEGDNSTLRTALDQLKNQLKSAVIVLATTSSGKVGLIAGITADLTNQLAANELVNYVAQQVGGKGGGRADIAQAGGTHPENLASALANVKDWVAAKLTNPKLNSGQQRA